MEKRESEESFHLQALSAIMKPEAKTVDKLNLPKETMLGVVVDVFTGSATELPTWLERNKPSSHPEKGDRAYIEVFPDCDLRRDVFTTCSYGVGEIRDLEGEARREWRDTGDVQHLKDYASCRGILDGKWYGFFPREVIDDVWSRVATAIVTGSLPSRRASVTLGGDEHRNHRLSVYDSDFRDIGESRHLEMRLRDVLEIPGMRLLYRPLYVSYILALADPVLQEKIKSRHRDFRSEGRKARRDKQVRNTKPRSSIAAKVSSETWGSAVSQPKSS